MNTEKYKDLNLSPKAIPLSLQGNLMTVVQNHQGRFVSYLSEFIIH